VAGAAPSKLPPLLRELTEGFDTPDLIDAQSLLDKLASKSIR
jgi:hypothetical protein